jgi:putative flippase GtrA
MTAEPEKPAPSARHAGESQTSRKASAVVDACIKVLPTPIRRRLETEAGRRFSRFLPVAIAALASSQISLAILTGLNMTAGKAALLASIIGAAVSYVLSRWAWDSRGRPDLLRETVPFWLVSFAVWGILSLATHYAGAYANAHHLHHLQKHLVVQGTYFAANCITFVTRFLIFHYVLFRKTRVAAAQEAVAQAAAPEPPHAGTPSSQLAQSASEMALTPESAAIRAERKP